MKLLSLLGLSLSLFFLVFGLYLIFLVVPAAEEAAAEMDRIAMEHMEDYSISLFEVPGYEEAMITSEKKVDYGMVLLFGSIAPFLLCIVPAIKKNKMAIIGLIISIGTFFIGAAYGSHMFS